MTFEQLQEKVLCWANDKNLLHAENADKQFLKFIEEVFEFKSEFDCLDRISLFKDEVEEIKATQENMQLEMGDIFVTLIILCEQIGIDPEECLSMAYEKIKNRRGRTLHGTFVKAEDLDE